MHRSPRRWPVVLLAVAVVCSGSAIAWSQQLQATYPPVDPAYSAPVGMTRTVPMSAQSANHQIYQTAMSAENAGLAARVEKLEAAAAAAKKKASSGLSAKIGGRAYTDWTTYDQDAGSKLLPGYGNQENGVEFRTTRLAVKGSGYNVFSYGLEMDFASRNRVAFKDTYMQISDLPILGNVKAGFFKEPFSMEELTSDKFTTFTERNMANLAYSVSRRTGVMAFDTTDSERLSWQLGVFSTNDDGMRSENDEPPFFEDDNGGTAVTMRLFGTPWYDEATEGCGVLHTGIAYSYRDIADASHRFRVRPEDHLGDYVLDTTFANIDNYEMLNVQAAFVYGPFSIQSEYYMVATDGINANPSDTLDGGYVFVSYFLTGENRNYSRSAGAFSRVKPFENFFRVRTEDGTCQTGKGAWEIAYRFSTVDFASGVWDHDGDNGTAMVAGGGGNVNNHTFGINWYLNPNMRLMANFVHSDAFRDNNHGSENIFITRAQVDW
ncbi:MAG TPA: porin [Thermoguttaceae bacterium]|nr:porin [Thermoguttaceae bacterium]